MLGERSPQRGLFEADNLYLDFVGRDTFYGFLACHRGELFCDKDFAEFYKTTTGEDKRLATRFHEMYVKRLKKSHDKLTAYMNKV